MKNIFSHRSVFKYSFIFSSFILCQSSLTDGSYSQEPKDENSWNIHYDNRVFVDNHTPKSSKGIDLFADDSETGSKTNNNTPQFSGYHSPGQLIFPIDSPQPAQNKAANSATTQTSTLTPTPTPSAANIPSQQSQTQQQPQQQSNQTVIPGNPNAPTQPSSVKRASETPDQTNTPKPPQQQSPQQPLLEQQPPKPAEAPKQNATEPKQVAAEPQPVEGENGEHQKSIVINFNNVSIIEYIRFISRLTNKNFVFDESDLQFNVTIVSEEPASFENIMTALLQVLRIHDLALLEQGNNFIIHKNPRVNAISQLVSDDISNARATSEIVTQVFRLNTAEASQVATVIKPLTSQFALVEVLIDSNHLIITDLSTNVAQIAKLIKSLDSPASGLVIGQYVVRTTAIETLIPIALKIMNPIAQGQQLTMVPWEASNSIFVVSTPYLVERSLSILQHIDQNQKATKIFDLTELKYNEQMLREEEARKLPPGGLFINNLPYQAPKTPTGGEIPGNAPPGGWQLDKQGNWILQLNEGPEGPGGPGGRVAPPKGTWQIDEQGVWFFKPGEREAEEAAYPPPSGQWLLNTTGQWYFMMEQGQSILRKVSRTPEESAIFPLGPKIKSLFHMFKLQYRKGDTIIKSLQSIAQSLLNTEHPDEEFIRTIQNVQWLEPSNSLLFTGKKEVLLKARDLVEEIDVPLRQVFIEMLILETSFLDSLHYGVNWGTGFGGGNWAGAQGFTTPETGLLGTNSISSALGTGTPLLNNALMNQEGFDYGIIGQKIVNTALGIEFRSMSALLNFLRTKNNNDVILNPKIITEDNVPAEIFVGINEAFKSQSIANDQGSTITSNFDFRDVGTRLRVTPLLGNSDIITLEISTERSAIIASTVVSPALANNAPPPNTTKSTTTTRIHLPDGYFIIISGMLNDNIVRIDTKTPCLGGIPIIGAAFKERDYLDTKTNQMIFIRPQIIDTEEKIQNLTRHQQDIWRFKRQEKKDWLFEQEEAFDWLNLRPSPTVDVDPVLETYDTY